MGEHSNNRPEQAPKRARTPVMWVIWALVLLCVAIELTLVAADAGLIGDRSWRGLTYQNGAFWAGLLHNWRPNYPSQPWLMFVTYAYLHASFWHLAGNMLTLVILGDIARSHLRAAEFLALYMVSAIGGAATFGLLTNSPSPMVGASGALFGLVGAWQYWEWQRLRRSGFGTGPVIRVVIGLAALNLLMWVAMDGVLAWETHLGGFVTGWVMALVLDRWHRRKGTAPD